MGFFTKHNLIGLAFLIAGTVVILERYFGVSLMKLSWNEIWPFLAVFMGVVILMKR